MKWVVEMHDPDREPYIAHYTASNSPDGAVALLDDALAWRRALVHPRAVLRVVLVSDDEVKT